MRSLNPLFLWPLFFLWACSSETAVNEAPKGALSVEIFVVTPGPFNSEVKVTAELLAFEQVELKAPVAGQVLQISFEEGSYVNKGDAIVRIDDREWLAQSLAIKAEIQTSSRDLERKKSLLEIEGASQEEVDMLSSKVAGLEAELEKLQVQISRANVKAPFSGQLGMRNFSLGAYLKEGDVITTVTDNSQLKIDFDLPQQYQSSLSDGNVLEVILGEDTLPAKIYAVDPQINQVSRTIHVRAALSQIKNRPAMPGSFAEVLLPTNHTDSALLVPSQSIVPQMNDETVFLCKNGKAVRQSVVSGERTRDQVRILRGLNAGDSVLTTGLLLVREGMPLNIQPPSNLSAE